MPYSRPHRIPGVLAEYIIYSNLWIAFGAGALSYGFCILFRYPEALLYAIFAAAGTCCVYTFQRFVKSRSNVPSQTDQLRWFHENGTFALWVIVLSGIAAAVSFFLVLKNWMHIAVLMGILGFLSVFYVIRIVRKPLREVAHLKIHLVALVWIGVCAVFPMLNEWHYDTGNLLFALGHYFYFVAITIPFDIRDMVYDKGNMRTIPQVRGERGAVIISVVLYLTFLGFTVFFRPEGLHLFSFPFIAVACYHLLLLITARKTQGKFFAAGAIDAGILFLGLVYIFS